MRHALCACFGLFALAGSVMAQEKGVISDPDGYVNLREGKGTGTPVVAKIKEGEVFTFEAVEGSDWWKVKLSSGKKGWVHSSRLMFSFTEKDLPRNEGAGDELSQYGKLKGFDYFALAAAAAKADPAAMTKFYGLDDVDGGAAESHYYIVSVVSHLVGDEKLADFLAAQTPAYRRKFRENLLIEPVTYPFEPQAYFRNHFPKTPARL